MASSSRKSRPEVEAVRALLDKRLRVELSDGRTVEGILDCYDDSGNMILTCTTDVSSKVSSSSIGGQIHRMGTVLVPGHAQVSVKVFRRTLFPRNGSGERAPLLRMNELRTELEPEKVYEIKVGEGSDKTMESVGTDDSKDEDYDGDQADT